MVIEAFSARHLELLAPSNFSSPYDLPPQQRKNLFFMSAERLDGYIGNYVVLSQEPYQSAGLARIIDLDIQCAQLVFGRLMQAELLCADSPLSLMKDCHKPLVTILILTIIWKLAQEVSQDF